MRLMRMWGRSGFQDFAKYCMSWVEITMDCEREDWDRYLIGGTAICALDNHPSFSEAVGFISPRNDTYAKVALHYLSLYRDIQTPDRVDPSSTRPAAAIVALQIIRTECSDVERQNPKKLILGTQLVHALTWAAENTPKKPVHFRPLALEIFTLIGGMWFDPWVDEIPPEDKARFIDALGNVLDTPNLTPKNRDPLTPWPPGRGIDNYQEMFEGRTGSFVRRSSDVYLIPLLFGFCSSKSWQAHLKKSTFDFASHKTFKPGYWVIWLRHTWKMIARDSRLDIRLVATRLKELECYDVLALVIRSMWLSPDPDMLPHHWGWVEQETLWLFRARGDPDWGLFEGYLHDVSRVYRDPVSDDLSNPPGAAARYIFEYDGEPDGPIRERTEWNGQVITCYHDFELDIPDQLEVDQSCLLKRLCQFLAREMGLEGLHAFWKRKEVKAQSKRAHFTSDARTKNPSYFVCDYP